MNLILGKNIRKFCLKNYWKNPESVIDFIEDIKSTLKELNLFWCNLDSYFINSISEIKGLNLTSFRLRFCEGITDTTLKKLVESQKNIKKLEVNCCSKLTNDAIITICDNFPTLQLLRIFKCFKITDVSFSLRLIVNL